MSRRKRANREAEDVWDGRPRPPLLKLLLVWSFPAPRNVTRLSATSKFKSKSKAAGEAPALHNISAPRARQLQLEHLTEGLVRVLNRSAQKICGEDSRREKKIVLVCRTVPA